MVRLQERRKQVILVIFFFFFGRNSLVMTVLSTSYMCNILKSSKHSFCPSWHFVFFLKPGPYCSLLCMEFPCCRTNEIYLIGAFTCLTYFKNDVICSSIRCNFKKKFLQVCHWQIASVIDNKWVLCVTVCTSITEYSTCNTLCVKNYIKSINSFIKACFDMHCWW